MDPTNANPIANPTTGRIHRSTDLGQTFTVVPSTSTYGSPNWQSVSVAANGTWELAAQSGEYARELRPGGVYRSSDGGLTWSVIPGTTYGTTAATYSTYYYVACGKASPYCLVGKSYTRLRAKNGAGVVWHLYTRTECHLVKPFIVHIHTY